MRMLIGFVLFFCSSGCSLKNKSLCESSGEIKYRIILTENLIWPNICHSVERRFNYDKDIVVDFEEPCSKVRERLTLDGYNCSTYRE